jgi:hypothetical protein
MNCVITFIRKIMSLNSRKMSSHEQFVCNCCCVVWIGVAIILLAILLISSITFLGYLISFATNNRVFAPKVQPLYCVDFGSCYILGCFIGIPSIIMLIIIGIFCYNLTFGMKDFYLREYGIQNKK